MILIHFFSIRVQKYLFIWNNFFFQIVKLKIRLSSKRSDKNSKAVKASLENKSISSLMFLQTFTKSFFFFLIVNYAPLKTKMFLIFLFVNYMYLPSTNSSLLVGWDRLGPLECKLWALPTWIHRSDSGGRGGRDSTCLQWASSRGENSSSVSRQLINSFTLCWRSSCDVKL